MKRVLFCLMMLLALTAFAHRANYVIVTPWGNIHNLIMPDTLAVLEGDDISDTLYLTPEKIWSSATTVDMPISYDSLLATMSRLDSLISTIARVDSVLGVSVLRTTYTNTDSAHITGGIVGIGTNEYENANISMYAINKSGATVTKGLWVAVDDSLISVVDSDAVSSDPETLTVAISLADEGSYSRLAFFPISIGGACSLKVVGVDKDGAAQTDTIVTSTDDTEAFSDVVWDTVGYCIFLGADANDSVQVRAYSVNGFIGSASNDLDVLGVVADDSIKDNVAGRICVYGIVDYAVVNASSTTGLPGYFLEATGTSNYADPNASITATGSCCGILLEATDAVDTVRAFILNK